MKDCCIPNTMCNNTYINNDIVDPFTTVFTRYSTSLWISETLIKKFSLSEQCYFVDDMLYVLDCLRLWIIIVLQYLYTLAHICFYTSFHTFSFKTPRQAFSSKKRLQRKQLLKHSSRKERDLDRNLIQRSVFRITKQLANKRQDVAGVNCSRDESGNMVIRSEMVMKGWRGYMEHPLNT